NNQFEVDEITASGLTPVNAILVNAPLVEECFMNLECKFVWEKEIVPGDDHVLLCLEVIGINIDEEHLSERTGENGILFNIHHQQNPKLSEKTGHDWAAVLTKKIDMGEY
ncbi:MAG: flavin reductase, partial [Treponema sp.]|nr:flavin reductase [Treponema sp.]